MDGSEAPSLLHSIPKGPGPWQRSTLLGEELELARSKSGLSPALLAHSLWEADSPERAGRHPPAPWESARFYPTFL